MMMAVERLGSFDDDGVVRSGKSLIQKSGIFLFGDVNVKVFLI